MHKISFIVPVYNESKTVVEVLKKLVLLELSELAAHKQIIVVDDGSMDGSGKVIEEYSGKINANNCEFKLITHQQNLGKGAAVRTGIKESTGDIIAIQDGDLEYNPAEFPKLINTILGEKYDAVYGSRFMADNPVIYPRYYLGNRVISILISLLFLRWVSDSYTCYKVFRKDILDKIELRSNGFEIEAEVTCKLLAQKNKICVLPISYSPRTIATGKKIKFKDAITGIITILRVRFGI